jgi:16S rRNA (uracil1498-N3)-methyltransferase
MQNLPRIFLNENLEAGKSFPLAKDQLHYLTKVMRLKDNAEILIFNNGLEFVAKIANCSLIIANSTNRSDPSNNITLCFAPIKRLDEMLNMATQMGVAKLQPVITERTTARHTNWDRMRKIITEAAEQSGRNSVPELLPEIKFKDFIKGQMDKRADGQLIFADERKAGQNTNYGLSICPSALLSIFIGPEGGFSEGEFSALDAAGAIPLSLGKTILRAETAAVAALAKIL